MMKWAILINLVLWVVIVGAGAGVGTGVGMLMYADAAPAPLEDRVKQLEIGLAEALYRVEELEDKLALEVIPVVESNEASIVVITGWIVGHEVGHP